MEGLGLNLYINAFIVACFETVSFIIADNLISILPRRNTVLIGIVIACGLSFLFIVLRAPADCGSYCVISILQIIMTGLIRFVVCFVMGVTYTYIPELFPTPVRS
jgi:MFS family permease